MDAPLEVSCLFGDAVDSVVDRYQEARKQAMEFQWFLPCRSIVLGAAVREPAPAPHTGRFRNRVLPLVLACSGTEVDDVLKSRGLLRQGPCFRLGSPRRSGPDIHSSGLLRSTPREEQSAPHYTMSVSPHHPLEIVLPTLPEFQGSAVSSESLSQLFPHGIVAKLRALPPLQGSLD